MSDELSDYYIKLGVGSKFSTELSNISYLLKELKKARNSLNNSRQRKAEARKEFYELLISLRLNMDKLKDHLPHHEAAKLEQKIKEISTFEKKKPKPVKKKESKKGKSKKQVKKKEEKPAARKEVKPVKKKPDMLASEKRELELLKEDLESISRELRRKR